VSCVLSIILFAFISIADKTLSSLASLTILETQLPYPKLPNLYKSVDAFVLTSHGEGLSVVVD
jgi:hypothetical protein